MRKALMILVAMMVLFSLELSFSYNKTSTDLSEAFPFHFKSTSFDGYYQIYSESREESQFRDIKTGRIIQRIFDSENDYGPIIVNKYIYTSNSNKGKFFDEMTLMDKDGNKKELKTSDGELLLFFDDEIIQIHEERVDDSKKIIRSVNDEVVWQQVLHEKQNWTKGVSKNFSYRDYIWITDGENLKTKAIDARDGKIVFEKNAISYKPIYTNGYLAVCIFSSPDQKLPCVTVVDIETGEVIWEHESGDFENCFFDGNTVAILFANKQTANDIFIVNRENGLVANYKTPDGLNGHIIGINEYFACYTTKYSPYFEIRNIQTNLIVWKPTEELHVIGARFIRNCLLVNSTNRIFLLDLESFDICWNHKIRFSKIIGEYDVLEYIRIENSVKVRDTKFDVIEPYEYNLSILNKGHAELIPTKFGLLLIPNFGNNNSFNGITLMKPGIDKPAYSHYVQSGWLKSWERTEYDEIIKLVWTYHGNDVEDDTWYLHIPTGMLSTDPPK